MTIDRSTIKFVGDYPEKHYTRVPNALIYDKALQGNHRMVAVYIWSLGDGWDMSVESIRKALRMSNKTVGDAINALIARGWLRRHETHGPNGGVNWYGYTAHRSRPIDGFKSTVPNDTVDSAANVESTVPYGTTYQGITTTVGFGHTPTGSECGGSLEGNPAKREWVDPWQPPAVVLGECPKCGHRKGEHFVDCVKHPARKLVGYDPDAPF